MNMNVQLLRCTVQKNPVKIINYYNPCHTLTAAVFKEMMGEERHREVWCGDFNAHNSLWGSDHTDNNGTVVEEMMDTRNLVCLNNGGGTRLDVNRNKMSCIDLTLVSASMYSLCDWEICKDNIGSDHFPIMCTIEIDKCTQERAPIYRWCFKGSVEHF